MANRSRQVGLGAAAMAGAAGFVSAQTFNEHFDAVNAGTGAAGPGWTAVNLSDPIGTATYFQGDPLVFPAQAAPGYLGVNHESGAMAATISNWQISPAVLLENGGSLSFYTRTVANPFFADRLQVRMATIDSTNVGASATSVGDFTALLLDINPGYVPVAYPSVWTQYVVTLSGLPAGGVTGRLAFRYFVENGGIFGTNSDYIGIDEAVYPAVTGACCLPDQTCILTTMTACAPQFGVYKGDQTSCSIVNCLPPLTGACCLADGTCQVRAAYLCTGDGGVFFGANTTCIQANCGPVCTSVGGLNIPVLDGGNPSNGTAGPDAIATLDIADHGLIAGLVVKVRITHSYQGDVRFRLVHPDNTTVDLVNRPGVAPPKQGASVTFGFASANFGSATANMLFRDGAAAGRYDNATGFPGPPPGTAIATENVAGAWIATGGPLAAFNGKDVYGTWRLIANDYASGDVGLIRSFTVCATVLPVLCYANCDLGTTVPCLNVADFGCFLNRFAAGDTYANCDNSTIVPVLNVSDFACFLNTVAAGCSAC